MEDIITEARALVADGVVEITLLGQNVNSYGRDLYGAPQFAELLRDVGATGVERLRFATSHPKDLSDATISAMAEVPVAMPYLHLPVQHGSDRILRAMRRGYTRAQYLARVQAIRSAVPDIALSTDLIVGFPGETDEDFEQMLDLVATVGYDHAFTFIYSPREGTPAASMEGHGPREIAQVRFNRLAALVQQLSHASNAAEVGRVRDVLIEGPSRRDGQMLSARTAQNRLVHMPLSYGADAADLAGTIVPARIVGAHPWFLDGELVSSIECRRLPG